MLYRVVLLGLDVLMEERNTSRQNVFKYLCRVVREADEMSNDTAGSGVLRTSSQDIASIPRSFLGNVQLQNSVVLAKEKEALLRAAEELGRRLVDNGQ